MCPSPATPPPLRTGSTWNKTFTSGDNRLKFRGRRAVDRPSGSWRANLGAPKGRSLPRGLLCVVSQQNHGPRHEQISCIFREILYVGGHSRTLAGCGAAIISISGWRGGERRREGEEREEKRSIFAHINSQVKHDFAGERLCYFGPSAQYDELHPRPPQASVCSKKMIYHDFDA